MLSLHAVLKLSLIILILFTRCTIARNVNGTADDSTAGGIQLAAWNIHEFDLYFSVILTLLGITLFKMYFPKVPYVPIYIPQSLLLIVLGVIFGLILQKIGNTDLENTLWKLRPVMFFHFLLPPIILEAAYSLYGRTLLDYLGSILIYAVVGTVINFLIIGPLMFGLIQIGAMGGGLEGMSLNACLLFASLIVAVDPVAVLAIFQDIGVELGLYFMVFGESLLNDAVTVVLYRIMSEFVGIKSVMGEQVGLGIGSFFTISLGGLFIGVSIGISTSVFTRWTGHFGCFLVFLMAYFSYILSETLGWSGIISTIGCGLVQAAYVFHNISPSALTSVHLVIKELASISEALIFFFIGVQLFTDEIEWHTGFCLWGMVVCLGARTVVVLLLTFIINWVNLNRMRVTLKQQAILIYGGLRGAVALSLALLIENQESCEKVRKKIVTATLFIILFTIGLMGLTMKPLVQFFRIKLAEKEELSLFGDLNGNVLDYVLAGVETIIGSNGRNQIRVYFTRLDDQFIRHWFQQNPETHDEKIIRTYENIALKLHYATIKPAKSSEYLQGLPEIIRQRHLLENCDSSCRNLPEFVATMPDYSNSTINRSLSSDYDKHTVIVEDANEDRENDYLSPSWGRRSCATGNAGPEDFETQLFDVFRSKLKASRFSLFKKNKSKATGRGWEDNATQKQRKTSVIAKSCPNFKEWQG